MPSRALLASVLLVLAGTMLPAAPQVEDPREPVPAPEELEAARGKLRELYSEELGEEGPETARELALTLWAQAERAAVGGASHYVLVEESIRSALLARDGVLFLGYLDDFLAAYEVDELQTNLWAFEAYDPRDDGKVTGVRIAERCLRLAGQGARAGDAKSAQRLIDVAAAIGKANDLFGVRERCWWLTDEIKDWEKLTDKARRARRKLEEDPGNVRAHLDIARHLLAVSEDWDGAREHLRHSPNPKILEALERDDLVMETGGRAAQAESCLDLARRWRAIAEKERKGALREAFFGRALLWYESALAMTPDLLDRGEIEKERDEILPLFGPDRVFLADREEIFLHAPLGELGKDGWMGLTEDEVRIGGVLRLHSLGLHGGGAGDDALVRYDLGRAWKILSGAVAINDTSRMTRTEPLDFRIFGDAKLLWTSEILTTVRDAQPFEVSVQGVKTLELRIVCHGLNRSAHTTWVEPELER